jgi:cytidylate kinase
MPPARSVEALVERQAQRWEVARRSARAQPPAPCVALSRLPHAGASEIGQRVAQKLDFGFFGIEIVDWIAREHRVQRALVEGLDERARSLIDRYVADAFRSRALTESEYLRYLVRVLATLGERGRAVILGRGAPYVLAPERTLRVLVTAPAPARAARLASARGIGAEEARATLAREDAERREFVCQHFGLDPDDPLHYDVVLNTGTLGIDAATALVLEALRLRFGSVE